MSEAEAQAAPGVAPRVPLSRREFLYYLWGASMALFMAQTGGALLWFSLPRFREGEFGGAFSVPLPQVPPVDSGPAEYAAGRFWLVNLGEGSLADPRQPADYALQPGVKAIYKVCTHLGCLYRWADSSDRFECPCHGSKFLKTGARVDGPARRNLDAFVIEAVDAAGNVLARTETGPDGEALPLTLPAGTAALRVDTGRRLQGAPNSRPGGGR